MSPVANSNSTVRRSWLLVPLSDKELTQDSWRMGADVIVLDLMELVAERNKPQARDRAKAAIASASRGGSDVFLQVDKELLYADLKACVWPGLNGIVLPRLETVEEVHEADQLLLQMEKERGMPSGSLEIVASVETATGNYNAMEIARSSSRMWGITLGRADLVMELRPEPSGELHLMAYLMQRVITIANACGIVPLGAWWREPARGLLAGPKDTYEAAVRGRSIGFKGSMCIRQEQVEPLNQGFTPPDNEVRQARSLITALTEAEAAGDALVSLEARIVDQPTGRAAQRLIDRSEACSARDRKKETL